MLRQKISQKINFYLDDLATPIGKLINIAIAILVLASAISFVAQTYEISEITRHRLNLLDDIILGVFVFEYFLRLICAEQKLKHLFSLYAIIDLVAILPFFLGAIDVTFIRLLRWFRILRLIRLVESRTLFAHKTEDIAILFRILFTLLAIVFVFSGLVYQIEHPSNPKYAVELRTVITDLNQETEWPTDTAALKDVDLILGLVGARICTIFLPLRFSVRCRW